MQIIPIEPITGEKATAIQTAIRAISTNLEGSTPAVSPDNLKQISKGTIRMDAAVDLANTIATAHPNWTGPTYDNAQVQEDMDIVAESNDIMEQLEEIKALVNRRKRIATGNVIAYLSSLSRCLRTQGEEGISEAMAAYNSLQDILYPNRSRMGSRKKCDDDTGGDTTEKK